MARPEKYRNPKSTSFTLEREEYEELIKIARREGDDIGEVLRNASLEYIRLHSEGNSSFILDKWQENPNYEAIPNIFAEDSKIKSDYDSSNNQERNRRFKNIQRIKKIYQDINYRDRSNPEFQDK